MIYFIYNQIKFYLNTVHTWRGSRRTASWRPFPLRWHPQISSVITPQTPKHSTLLPVNWFIDCHST